MESYTPTGATAAALTRFTAAEALTGTYGADQRTQMTELADRTRLLLTTGVLRFPASALTDTDANSFEDAEKGTWTPTDASGAGLSLVSASGTYEKFSRCVIARCTLTFPATADVTNALIGGLPFTVFNANDNTQGFIGYTDESTLARPFPTVNTANAQMISTAGTNITNATLTGNVVRFTAIYRTY